jgi:NDP-sugar pyrophosphorylase family protein
MPELMILAAGLGTRFGGSKQLAAVGPRGETLMDYAVFDAARAGFSRVIFLIRPGMDPSFRREAEARYGARIEVAVVHQDIEAAGLAVGRTKPWGTAHAVLVGTGVVRAPFAVVNADDFYGAEAYVAASGFLRAADEEADEWALVGYRLGDTRPHTGAVNRAICRVDAGGYVLGLEETAIARQDPTPDDAVVSMNFWLFTPNVAAELHRGFDRFLRIADLARDEFLLPAAVGDALARGAARVRVLRHGGRWFGLTHPEDLAGVRAVMRDLAREGRYPDRLWP